MPRLILLGIGSAESPRFAPAGLLIEYGHTRIGIDGGPGSEPPENVDAWLVTDEHGPLQPGRRRLAHEEGMADPAVAPFQHGPLHIDPVPVAHIDAAVYGYRIKAGHHTAVWAPEFAKLPDWGERADLMFAGAADVPEAAAAAQRFGVRRLVFVCLGEDADPRIEPPFGEWGEEGGQYRM